MHKGYKALCDLVELRAEKAGSDKDRSKPYVGLEHLAPECGGIIGSMSAGDSVSINSVFEKGDILLGKLRPALRKCARVSFAGYCSTDLLVLRARDGVDDQYAYHVLCSPHVFNRAIRTAEGTKMPRTSWAKVRNTMVYFPNLRSQRRIAEVLDSVDESIRSTERLIAKQGQARQGLINAGFCDVGVGRPLGEMILEGPQNGLYKPASSYVDSGRAIIRIDSFDGGVVHSIGRLKRVRINATEARTYELGAGDLLINRVNTIDLVGKSALVPHLTELTIFESNIMRLRLDVTTLLPQYAILWLNTAGAMAHFYRSAKSAIGQASINQADVRSCPIPTPSLSEQLTTVAITDQAAATIDSTYREVAKLRMLKQALMQDLLKGRVRVGVGEDVAA